MSDSEEGRNNHVQNKHHHPEDQPYRHLSAETARNLLQLYEKRTKQAEKKLVDVEKQLETQRDLAHRYHDKYVELKKQQADEGAPRSGRDRSSDRRDKSNDRNNTAAKDADKKNATNQNQQPAKAADKKQTDDKGKNLRGNETGQKGQTNSKASDNQKSVVIEVKASNDNSKDKGKPAAKGEKKVEIKIVNNEKPDEKNKNKNDKKSDAKITVAEAPKKTTDPKEKEQEKSKTQQQDKKGNPNNQKRQESPTRRDSKHEKKESDERNGDVADDDLDDDRALFKRHIVRIAESNAMKMTSTPIRVSDVVRKSELLIEENEALSYEVQRLKFDNAELIKKSKHAEEERIIAQRAFATSETAREELEKRLEREIEKNKKQEETLNKQTQRWIKAQQQLQYMSHSYNQFVDSGGSGQRPRTCDPQTTDVYTSTKPNARRDGGHRGRGRGRGPSQGEGRGRSKDKDDEDRHSAHD